MRTRIAVDPKILNWAIRRAGYSPSDFFAKLPDDEKWIERDKKPTAKQLEKFSRRVHIPFGYLFLSEPPQEELPIPYFRTGSESTNASLELVDTYYILADRQNWLREYLEESGEERLRFVGRFRDSSNLKAIVQDIRKTLGLEEMWASHYRTWAEALDALAERIERAGIIVVFNSVVGNDTHRRVEVSECRGFVLVDEVVPFMFVNSADSKSAQMFTMAHELAHIWTGRSAGFDLRRLLPASDPGELLCDRVAAEFLVPIDAFEKVWAQYNDIAKCSRHFKVSELVVARRALDAGKISRRVFFNLYKEYIGRDSERIANKQGGGDFYSTARRRISLRFARYVYDAVRANRLLHREAYRLTGLKGRTFSEFCSRYLSEV
jgi:Zn-dependent peptidase ImmA (M78 family)